MFLLNATNELNLKNSAYHKAVKQYVWEAYKSDLGKKGDLTTKYFVPKKKQLVTGEIVANEKGILAGILEAEWFLKRLGIEIIRKRKDGTLLKKGTMILKLQGPAYKILAAERTLLNLLQRMSGIATITNKLAAKLPKSIKVLATRKTIWGLLDKRAVTVGGGKTHRLDLSDAILIKDNHLALVDDWEKSLKRVFRKAKKVRFVEIELENIPDIERFLVIYQKYRDKYSLKGKIVVMFDNFKLADIKKIAPKLRRAGILVEVSGGISEQNIKRYNIKGVSAVSSGAITNKAIGVDMNLHFNN